MDNSVQRVYLSETLEPEKDACENGSMRDPLEPDESISNGPIDSNQEPNNKACKSKEPGKEVSLSLSSTKSTSPPSQKRGKRNFYCHMPSCRRKRFVQGYAYLKHLRSHKRSSVYGCTICKLCIPGINAIISHIREVHRIKRDLCVQNFYVEKALWTESHKGENTSVQEENQKLSGPSLVEEKVEPIAIKYKRQLVCTIDVNDIHLPNTGRGNILDELEQFVNGGLYDSLLDIVY